MNGVPNFHESGTLRDAMGTGTGKTRAVVDATVKGKMPDGNMGPNRGQGETPGVGQINSVVLNQRTFTSNPRNQGPDGEKSIIGAQDLPIVTTAARKTGRIA